PRKRRSKRYGGALASSTVRGRDEHGPGVCGSAARSDHGRSAAEADLRPPQKTRAYICPTSRKRSTDGSLSLVRQRGGRDHRERHKRQRCKPPAAPSHPWGPCLTAAPDQPHALWVETRPAGRRKNLHRLQQGPQHSPLLHHIEAVPHRSRVAISEPGHQIRIHATRAVYGQPFQLIELVTELSR